MAARPNWDREAAVEIIARHRDVPGATLPILHELQATFGYVDESVIPLIAKALNLSNAEVAGTISFYHDFRSAPATGKVIKLCRAEACQSVGCEDLVDHLSSRGVAVDGAHGPVTVETVYCLGNCALGPSILINGTLVGAVDADRLDAELAGVH